MTVLNIPAGTQIITLKVVNNALTTQRLNIETITEIIIPESVSVIGSNAFNGCRSLTSIVIPENVTEIGEGAFEGCINLKTIYVSDMLADKGKDYWAQRGIDTDSVTLIRHSEIKTWVDQQKLFISYNNHNQAALYDWCQRQANPEQGPKEIALSKIPYADLIKLAGYHNDALLVKIPRTLNGLNDTNYSN